MVLQIPKIGGLVLQHYHMLKGWTSLQPDYNTVILEISQK